MSLDDGQFPSVENSTDFEHEFLVEFEDLFLMSNWSNWTSNVSAVTLSESGRDLLREIPLGILLTCLCLMTSVGNAMVLHAVRTERRLQTVSNMFIVSLAIADLIVGLVVMPVSTIYIFTEAWMFGVAVCQIWIVTDYIASTASILNLFILSLDRYWSVTSPLKYLRRRTKKRALVMISLAWLLSSLWIIPITGWHHFFTSGRRTVAWDVCDTEFAKNSALKVVTAFFNFYLPLAIMYGLYWKIFQEIRKRSELELGQRNSAFCKNYNSYIPTTHSCNDDISYSDQAGDTYSDNNSLHVEPHMLQADITIYDLSLKHKNKDKSKSKGYFGMKFSKKNKSNSHNGKGKPHKQTTVNSFADRKFEFRPEKSKIEYVYDENVIDEETEKVERYFYEDLSSIPAIQKPNHILLQNNTNVSTDLSASSPSTPASSLSSMDDKRTKSLDRDKFTLVSGFKKLRDNEKVVDNGKHAGKTKPCSNQRHVFVFRDERTAHRRPSNVFNIKNRLKNIRQSSALTKEIKAARQLGVIMGAFTVCFLPYFILFLVVAFCDGCIDQGLLLAMTWVGYLNSTLNPLLYPLCNANFRRKFRNMFGLRAKRRHYCHRDGVDRNSITTARYD